jgi:hypothetical protein
MDYDTRYIFETEKINSDFLKRVHISKCPPWIEKACLDFKKEAYCHYNTMHLQELLVSMLSEDIENQVQYVIGYILRGVPVEHAFIKIGDHYFDPTIPYEETNNDEFYELLSMGLKERQQFTQNAGTSEHGVLMLNLRDSEQYRYLFNVENEIIMLNALNEMLNNESSSEPMVDTDIVNLRL